MKLTKKIPDTSGTSKKVHCNAKIIEIEGKISSINGPVSTAALNAAGNTGPAE